MIACFLSNISAKYYKNPSMLSRVIAKNVGDVFFETQCITESSACEWPDNPKDSLTPKIATAYSENRKGRKTDLCGTPNKSKIATPPLNETRRVRSVRNDRIQASRVANRSVFPGTSRISGSVSRVPGYTFPGRKMSRIFRYSGEY